MKLFRAKLTEKIERTKTVTSFRFIADEKIDFIAGQFVQVIFDEKNQSNKVLNKYLSFSSSTTKEYFEVTKRLSDSEFSNKLKGLNVGDEVLFKGPLGSCTLKKEYKKIGFLIGGIGITPVISILEYIVDKNINIDTVLFYSNKTDGDIAFKKELDHWQSVASNIKVIYTVTACEPKDNKCIYGKISKDLLVCETDDCSERIFFIFGPPSMVEIMKNLCLEVNCNKENIKTESFIGY